MSDQKVCPTCGTEYPLSERFCPRDGTALRSAAGQGDLLGTIVADRYHIIKKLGEGGMGAVYLAEHVKMGRKSALKVMHPGMNSDPDAIARFNREASNASRLSHPNICGIYDFGETPDGLIYLAMEFIEGKALADIIEQGGTMPPSRAGSIVHQTADALQLAHDAGIVHRDLKPDNIMVAKNRDGSDLVKVVDFGIAKASSSDAQKVTKTGLVVGTPEYMSPEQLAGDKLDGRSDTYSLGLVAFNCLTGKLPFPSETAQEAMIMRLTDRPRTLSEIRPEVDWPEELQAVMDRALARDAAERYGSAAQFGRDFAAAVADMPATASEGATMVIGAAKVTPNAAKTAEVAPPATRVAGGAGRGASPAKGAAATPPVVAKKSSVVPVVGGLAAAAVIGFFGYQQFAGKTTEPTTPDSSSVTPLSGVPSTDTSTNSQTFQRPLGNDGAQTQMPQTNTGNPSRPNAPANTPTSQPTGSQTRPAGNTSQTTQPTTTPPATAATNPPATTPANTATNPPASTAAATRDRLIAWQRELQLDQATREDANRVIRDSAPLRSGLSGTDLGEWHFTQMLAYTVLEDQDRMCPAARSTAQAFPSGHPKGGFADNFWRQYCQ